ncbi:ankyrin repeat-containing 2B [Actinidia rufa]|uniref:Ankyrin repeat-containing 2B n=1 Tax=Actinidia rufa TaxID=165716 RepID=A0A7J0E055_9ERIC|nr:ankyrin repeat-containing 2B [Actinidia rufa]
MSTGEEISEEKKLFFCGGQKPVYGRYWNDKEVLQKLGEAMGLAVVGDGTTSADISVPDETEEPGNEDESVVHHTASVGDVEALVSWGVPWSSKVWRVRVDLEVLIVKWRLQYTHQRFMHTNSHPLRELQEKDSDVFPWPSQTALVTSSSLS